MAALEFRRFSHRVRLKPGMSDNAKRGRVAMRQTA